MKHNLVFHCKLLHCIISLINLIGNYITGTLKIKNPSIYKEVIDVYIERHEKNPFQNHFEHKRYSKTKGTHKKDHHY